MNKPRAINIIALDIKKNWHNIYFAAEPYLYMLEQLKSIEDSYGEDSAICIIYKFLNNSNTWTGAQAEKLKKELKSLLL